MLLDLGVHHFVIDSGHLKILVHLIDMLLVLRYLLLMHGHPLWIALLPVDRSVLTSICNGFAYRIYFTHLYHWCLYLNGLLFPLAVALFILLVVALLRALIWSVKYSTVWLLGVKRWLTAIEVFLRVHGSAHCHVLVFVAIVRPNWSHLVTWWKSFTRCKKHRVEIIEMHLLQLGVLHGLARR